MAVAASVDAIRTEEELSKDEGGMMAQREKGLPFMSTMMRRWNGASSCFTIVSWFSL